MLIINGKHLDVKVVVKVLEIYDLYFLACHKNTYFSGEKLLCDIINSDLWLLDQLTNCKSAT